MLRIIILVCAVGVSHEACQLDTAIDTIRGERVAFPQQCAFLAQSMFAHTTLGEHTEGTYAKVVCAQEGRLAHTNRAVNGAIIDSTVAARY